jgi:hypothetical protein
VVSVAWKRAVGNSHSVEYERGTDTSPCPAGQFAVRAFILSGGTYVADNVPFHIVAP